MESAICLTLNKTNMEILGTTKYVIESICVDRFGETYYITKRENESFDEAVITDSNGIETYHPQLIADLKQMHKS